MNTSPPRVEVCIVTFKRPKLLAKALQSVMEQEFTTEPAPELSVLVVDNDPRQSALETFEQVCGGANAKARYVVAAPQGVVRARNKALEESSQSDFIVFLDDDEFAPPHWLERLLSVQRKFDADVVTGPVFPIYENAPDWVVRGGFFDSVTYPTGAEVKYVATNNTLVRGSIAREFRFDPRFDGSLGEDEDFFLRVQRTGVRAIWASDAVVYESVSPQRTTWEWLVRRAYSTANCHTRCCLYSSPGAATFVSRLIRAAGGLIAGILLLPTAVAGKHHAIRAVRFFYRAAGTLSALQGHSDWQRG